MQNLTAAITAVKLGQGQESVKNKSVEGVRLSQTFANNCLFMAHASTWLENSALQTELQGSSIKALGRCAMY